MASPLEPVVEVLDTVVATASRVLSVGPGDPIDGEFQPDLYELAFIASEAAALRHAATGGALPEDVAILAGSQLIRSARARIDGRTERLGLAADALDDPACRSLASAGTDERTHAAVLDIADDVSDIGLSQDLRLAAAELRRFGSDVIAPVAESVHRHDMDIPDEVIDGLSALGVFGLSVPAEYGGALDPADPDHLGMVVATENLSRFSLAVGGSLITRPEILARALLSGGTEHQRERWLPDIASGRRLVAVAVTEPDAGSDVASISLQARRVADGWSLRGTKTWSTFAGRADLLMVLARTDEEPATGHRGLSLFVVEKPRFLGHSFEQTQPEGGTMRARAIPTIGYRGMHSFEVVFDDWLVPPDALIGEAAGLGRGFHLQMGAFAAGRLQTAARAVGVMQAAFETARNYATDRKVFGSHLIAYPLTRTRLAGMVARIASLRVFTYAVSGFLAESQGQIEAAMVKSLACRAAEEITRDAMQIHGGYGYAEEYPISRLFVDARVLSIFEGTEEVLALRVIGRRLLEQAGDKAREPRCLGR
jgi:(2S)-methylsuccinyl-CoA dehydrogenase